jgi:nucleoside-diphosphate-sugar epimerase
MIGRVVVTGASGMLGSSLIEVLVREGVEVLAVIRPGSAKAGNIKPSPSVRIAECDVEELDGLPQKAAGKYDVFFHFAWKGVYGAPRNDVFLQNSDIRNTLRAVETAKKLGCRKFIGAGSQAEIGLTDKRIGCNPVCNPITPYGTAKYCAGKLGAVLAGQLNMEFNWCRILSTYGECDNGYTMIMNTLQKMLDGRECDLTDGKQIWDYLYCGDAARAFYLIAKNGVDGKSYPIGGGAARPLREYVEEMYGCAGNKAARLNFGAVPLAENAVKYLCADIEELAADTGFSPQTTFKDGITRVIEYIKNARRGNGKE